jgi:hypothetical protein
MGLLGMIVDPVGIALRNATADDEPETEEEKQSVAEALAWLRRRGGRGIPHAEAIRRLRLE